MKQSILILIVLCGLLLGGCSKSSKQSVRTGAPKNDTEFAKEVFELLVNGDETASELIDWENLNMFGHDVGKIYKGIADEGNARDTFAKGFIRGFSKSFKQSGGQVELTSNWREQSRDASNTVIAADGPRLQVLLITVSHAGGQQKVSSLNLK